MGYKHRKRDYLSINCTEDQLINKQAQYCCVVLQWQTTFNDQGVLASTGTNGTYLY